MFYFCVKLIFCDCSLSNIIVPIAKQYPEWMHTRQALFPQLFFVYHDSYFTKIPLIGSLRKAFLLFKVLVSKYGSDLKIFVFIRLEWTGTKKRHYIICFLPWPLNIIWPCSFFLNDYVTILDFIEFLLNRKSWLFLDELLLNQL